MKKMGFLFLGVALLISGTAQADDCQGFFEGMNCMLMSSALWSLSTLGAFQDPREAYISVLKDEAANYVASDDGAAIGAVLQDAISQVRVNDISVANLTDRDVALIILKSN
jgi:uncharacterized protein (TIGR02448 family)